MKQYLMVCDETSMEKLAAVFRENIQFVEVQGMSMTQNAQYNVLVTPVIPPVSADTPDTSTQVEPCCGTST